MTNQANARHYGSSGTTADTVAVSPHTRSRPRARTSLAKVVPAPRGVVPRASAVAERARARVRTAYVEAVAAGRVRAEAEHHVVLRAVQRARVASGNRREVAVPPRGALVLGLGPELGLEVRLQPCTLSHHDEVSEAKTRERCGH